MQRLLISAARKSSGKTSFSLGLAALLHARGSLVQTFKKGPDYIDPMWLAHASGRACFNLDFYTMPRAEIKTVYERNSRNAEVVVVEGNKGLYDGMDAKGSDCSAALAAMLGLPVILVVDASGITRGVAPLIHGYQSFGPDIRIAGVVLNKVAGGRHERKLRDAIEYYTDIPVFGAIHRCNDMQIEERHIGLIPSSEDRMARGKIRGIARVVGESVDVDRMLSAVPGPASKCMPAPAAGVFEGVNHVRIGVARDEAFGFYYPDDMEAMARFGAEIEYFDTIRDAALPAVDALFIGGGFPEIYLNELHRNASLRADIKRFVEAGLPVYAECGGLMYLCRDITYSGVTRAMVGALPANAKMRLKPVGRGYVQLQETPHHPWPSDTNKCAQIAAHEFHYSQLEDLADEVEFAYKVVRGAGIRDCLDGLVYKNTLASYAHHRNVGANNWVQRFVQHARDCKALGASALTMRH